MKPGSLLLYYPYIYTKEVLNGWTSVIVQFVDWDIRICTSGQITGFDTRYIFREMPEYTDEYMGYGQPLVRAQNRVYYY